MQTVSSKLPPNLPRPKNQTEIEIHTVR